MVLFCLLIGGWSVASSPQYLNKNDYFVVEASGRLAGSRSEWFTEVHVPVGGEVEQLVHYRNAQRQLRIRARNVTLGLSLPRGLELVRGRTTLYNDELPKGAMTEQDEGDVVDGGVNVGDYAPHGDAHLVIWARVVDDHLVEGTNELVVWAKASTPDAALCNSMEVIVGK